MRLPRIYTVEVDLNGDLNEHKHKFGWDLNGTKVVLLLEASFSLSVEAPSQQI